MDEAAELLALIDNVDNNLAPILPKHNVGVVRMGAYGDIMQATSVIAALKQQGYDITFYTSPPASDIVMFDPNIDRFFLQRTDELSLLELSKFWHHAATKHDKFVNLSDSVESSWLQLDSSIRCEWNYPLRHKHFNVNYVQFQHEFAGVPYEVPLTKFYPNKKEINWGKGLKPNAKVIVWAVAGSSFHKVSPHLFEFVDTLLTCTSGAEIYLIGSERDKEISKLVPRNARVHDMCGVWNARQSYTFTQQCADVLVSPETGIASAMSMEPLGKVILLSHSTQENLTRDWKNTISLTANDESLLHRLKNDAWKLTETGKIEIHPCQSNIKFTDLWENVITLLSHK